MYTSYDLHSGAMCATPSSEQPHQGSPADQEEGTGETLAPFWLLQ